MRKKADCPDWMGKFLLGDDKLPTNDEVSDVPIPFTG